MSKQFSEYLTSTIPLLKELIAELKIRFAYCSVLGVDSKGKNIAVGSNVVNIGENMFAERGFVVRVHNGKNYAEYSFNEISRPLIKEIVEKIEDDLILSARYKKSKFIKLEQYKLFDEEKISKDFARYYEGEEMDAETIVSNLKELVKELGAKEHVINAFAVYQQLDISKVFISPNKNLTQFYTWAGGSMMALVMKDGDVRNSHCSVSGVEPNHIFPELREHCLEKVYKDAIDLIHAEAPKSGVYDIIATPDITGLFAHEAFGHGVEMDMFVKGRSKGANYIGKRVASDLVTMHEGAKGGDLQVSSYFFDDEGVLAHDTIEIKDGILQTGISDLISALVLGTEPTGNGKRQSFERKVYTRMTSTYFEGRNSTLEEMIASIKDGFLIDVGHSGMEDPKNWGIQCAALIGREIKNGKLTGKVYSPIMMTGYVPDLLCSISMLATDVGHSGAGMCGKGYKEWVKVSCGGPYLKARVNIG